MMRWESNGSCSTENAMCSLIPAHKCVVEKHCAWSEETLKENDIRYCLPKLSLLTTIWNTFSTSGK